MRTNLCDLIADIPNVTVDRRAKLRGTNRAEMCRVFRFGSYREALNATSVAVPSVIVKEDGHAVLFDCGGSGMIWLCASENVSDTQTVMVETVQELFARLGVALVFDLPLGSVWFSDALR